MTVASRIRSRHIGSILWVYCYNLVAASMRPWAKRGNVMPSFRQALTYSELYSIFNCQQFGACFPGSANRSTVLPSCCLNRLLRVHPEIYNVTHHLQVALDLDVAT